MAIGWSPPLVSPVIGAGVQHAQPIPGNLCGELFPACVIQKQSHCVPALDETLDLSEKAANIGQLHNQLLPTHQSVAACNHRDQRTDRSCPARRDGTEDRPIRFIQWCNPAGDAAYKTSVLHAVAAIRTCTIRIDVDGPTSTARVSIATPIYAGPRNCSWTW